MLQQFFQHTFKFFFKNFFWQCSIKNEGYNWFYFSLKRREGMTLLVLEQQQGEHSLLAA
jgi:hypothetical protein